MSGKASWLRRVDVPFRVMDGECLLVPVRRNVAEPVRIVRLGGAAARVWLELGAAKRSDDLLESLTAHFLVDRGLAAADLAQVVERLRDLELIETGEAPCPTPT